MAWGRLGTPKRQLSGCPGTAVGQSRLRTSRDASWFCIFIPALTPAAAPERPSIFHGSKAHSAAPGTDIVGVASDPVAALDRFKSKHKLAIALASDETHKVLEAYGVWQQKTLYGRKFMGIVRATFLIGPDQRIARVWPKVSVAGHAQEVLEAAKTL